MAQVVFSYILPHSRHDASKQLAIIVQMYQRTKKKAYETTKEGKILTFSEFRAKVALCLCQEGQSIYKKRSRRPSAESVEQQLLAKKKKVQLSTCHRRISEWMVSFICT
ncbi:hypothetical protein NQ314_003417 [Rhamnusium bicolor]|uniref:Uncharacterized protein n=1 Tax=Rhamnusium bicolor TaxID=1586634 RepID=A0AAV8ZPW2_9CUCU|nr:hypothetical protein NQ314_003417 [Rhamnusium bicolor]